MPSGEFRRFSIPVFVNNGIEERHARMLPSLNGRWNWSYTEYGLNKSDI